MSEQYFLSNEEQERVEKLEYSLPLKLREILKGFKWALRKKNTSAVLIIDGRSGMGKTTLACQIGKYCNENFDMGYLYFNPDQFLEGLANAKPHTVHIFDEAMLLSNRSAMSAINKAAIQAMSMIRSKNILVIFCINSIFDMERNLVLSRADMLLHVYGDSLTDRGRFMTFYTGSDGIERLKLLYIYGKKYYDYRKPKSNFFATFGGKFILDDDAYEKKKQEGINQFLMGTEKVMTGKMKSSRDSLVIYLSKHIKMKNYEIADIAGLSVNTIVNIKSRYGVLSDSIVQDNPALPSH